MSTLLDNVKKHTKENKRLGGINYEQLQKLFTQPKALHHQK